MAWSLGHGEKSSRAGDPDFAAVPALHPAARYQILSSFAGTDSEIQAVTGGGRGIFNVGDRLASWELRLAS